VNAPRTAGKTPGSLLHSPTNLPAELLITGLLCAGSEEEWPGWLRWSSGVYGPDSSFTPNSFKRHEMRRTILKLGAQFAIILIVSTAPHALSQNIAGSISGSVEDPSGAAIVAAEITLTNTATGNTQTTTTNERGLFVLPGVLAGSYSLKVTSEGFQAYARSGIQLTPGEIRNLGTIVLTLGALTESVSVVDTPAVVQTASGEVSATVTGTQINDLALKGRDFLGLVSLVPGVVDDGSKTRDSTAPNAVGGIYINGARSQMKNFTVDGVTDLDTGSNNTLHYEPNMDSIAEVKVLTSNYQAEYGRSAGGLISVVTKSGTREFHGSGWWTHRHEQFNANNFFRNRNALAKTPYRYNIAGFSLGGPVYLPNKFNTDKSKLFFFASQEYTRRMVDFGNRFRNMPTEVERAGDFSQSLDTNGKLITVNDPLTGKPFPGNVIPMSRINKIGQSILNFFPTPNYVDPDPRQVYRRNYKAAASGSHPRRNDIVRIDVYPFTNLNGYFRYINDHDNEERPFQGFDFAHTTILHPNPGHGYAAHVSYTFTPMLFNEVSLGKSWNSWQWAPKYPDDVKRSALGDIPQWFDNTPQTQIESEALDAQMLPNIRFGGAPVNTPKITINNIQHVNHNDTYDFTDNLSYVKANHSIKIGVYYNHTDKVQVQGYSWNGAFNFARNKNNPYDTGHSYANTLLGLFSTYQESQRDINFHATYWGVEFYVQDNWRVNQKLTLDYGIRFYHLAPQIGRNYSFSVFDPRTYDRAKAPTLYFPGRDANGKRVAVNPLTGETTYAALVGKYVPGSGDYGNGFNVGGKNGYPWGLYTVKPLAAAPRFGFAYDIFGNGRSVLRGGFGIFYDRPRQLLNWSTAHNPPVNYAPTLYYGNLDTLSQAAGAIGPSNAGFPLPEKDADYPTVMNFSLGLQQVVPGLDAVWSVSYVGNVSRHLLERRNLNPIPLFARFDPANADPTLKGKPLPDDFLRPYMGHANLLANEFAASANYNSLQTSLNRRFSNGLGFGISYTWSKALGVANSYNDTITPYFDPRSWEYGPLNFDRTHVFSVNYMYDLPDLSKKIQTNKFLSAIIGNWSVSGITRFQSGQPVVPSFSTTYATDITGSSEGARITVIGDPHLPKSERTFYRNFRTEAFALTPVGSFGNAGVGILRRPGINNWDIALNKKIPVGLGEQRVLRFRAEFYNAFNHTQFSNIDTGARFDKAGNQVNPNFGAFTAARAARIISFALRFQF